MIPRLFVAPFAETEFVTLSPSDSHYLTRVLRKRTGDAVVLLDNSGYQYAGDLTDTGTVRIRAKSWVEAEPRQRIVLLCGLIKGDRMEWLLEKATELGVAEVRPCLTARTVAKGGRLDRWQKIVKEAAEQCERGRLPIIREPLPLQETLLDLPETRWALVERQDAAALGKSATGAAVAVGPEGGWSPDDVATLMGQGFMAATLGSRILRSETAALASLARLLHS